MPSHNYPECVRHLRPRKDVRLRHFFLCDGCTIKWTTEAFDGNAPLWASEAITGFCQLCNLQTQVRLRTWFLCDICFRVAGSIGRNHVAEQAILTWWRTNVESAYPHLVIVQNDESALRPRRDTDVSGEGPLDFLVRDTSQNRVLLGIENKTGRSSIQEMSVFQLDVSDCDSIIHHVRESNIPAYLIHAQVLERWHPPTVEFYTAGLWWTDMYELAANFSEVKMRRDEQRGAAYFRKQAFRDISTLPTSLFDQTSNLALAVRFKREGVPTLYSSP